MATRRLAAIRYATDALNLLYSGYRLLYTRNTRSIYNRLRHSIGTGKMIHTPLKPPPFNFARPSHNMRLYAIVAFLFPAHRIIFPVRTIQFHAGIVKLTFRINTVLFVIFHTLPPTAQSRFTLYDIAFWHSHLNGCSPA